MRRLRDAAALSVGAAIGHHLLVLAARILEAHRRAPAGLQGAAMHYFWTDPSPAESYEIQLLAARAAADQDVASGHLVDGFLLDTLERMDRDVRTRRTRRLFDGD